MRTLKVARMRKLALFLLLAAAPGAFAAEESAAEGHGATGHGADWRHWKPANQVDNIASLQRGARNFFGYCAGCHSLKYVRYSRMAEDLSIPEDLLQQNLLPPTAKPMDYVMAAMPGADAEQWFGKAPPDLSLISRSRGTDYLFQFLKTFYVDPSKPTGVNNLRLDGTAMPHVLSDLEGLKRAVFKNVEHSGEGAAGGTERVFDHFEEVSPGLLSHEEYDAFVRDIVNFLDYVGEPTQVARRALGVWVVLFLLAFTWLAWLLKKDYWKDVH